MVAKPDTGSIYNLMFDVVKALDAVKMDLMVAINASQVERANLYAEIERPKNKIDCLVPPPSVEGGG